MRKLTPVPMDATAHAVYLTAAAINSLIRGSTSKRTETAIRALIFTNQAIMQQSQKTSFGETVTLRR